MSGAVEYAQGVSSRPPHYATGHSQARSSGGNGISRETRPPALQMPTAPPPFRVDEANAIRPRLTRPASATTFGLRPATARSRAVCLAVPEDAAEGDELSFLFEGNLQQVCVPPGAAPGSRLMVYLDGASPGSSSAGASSNNPSPASSAQSPRPSSARRPFSARGKTDPTDSTNPNSARASSEASLERSSSMVSPRRGDICVAQVPEGLNVGDEMVFTSPFDGSLQKIVVPQGIVETGKHARQIKVEVPGDSSRPQTPRLSRSASFRRSFGLSRSIQPAPMPVARDEPINPTTVRTTYIY